MKKQNVFRLLSLMFLALTMSQPAHALDWLRELFNDYYNNEARGPLCYSYVNAKAGLGEGKVYVEWATGKDDYDADYINSHVQSESYLQSPDDVTAHRANSATYKDHKYVFFAAGDEGWEFEDLFSNEALTTVYTPQDAQTRDGYYAAQVVVRTTATDIDDQPELYLYARFALKVNINARGYSTLYYSKYNFKVPTGVTATTYKLGEGSGKLEVSTTYSAGQVIPAGEAVVLQGTPSTTYKFIPVKGTYTADAANILTGTDETAMTTGGEEYFALSWNSTKGVVGFYWMVANGAAFECPAHKAYLALSSAPGVKGFDLNGDDDATGIDNVDAEANDEAIYNLAGQRVGKMQKGINIVNGKKILKK